MQKTLARNDLALGPLYKRVKTLVTEGLMGGVWKVNDALPSESRLAEQFNVSIGTVRKAIDELVAEKILIRQQGRGTFVAAHSPDRYLYHFFHIVSADGTKLFPTTELLDFRRERPSSEVAERLGLARNARVLHIRNLLRLGDTPVEVDELFLSCALFPNLTKEMFKNRPGTIYQLYQEHYGVNIIRTSERLAARTADATAAELLGLREGAPVLAIERVAYTYTNSPVELRYSLVNTQHHVYLNDLEKAP